jgi:hypothetical protein
MATASVIANLSVFTALVLLVKRILRWTHIPQRLCGVGNVAFWAMNSTVQPLRAKLTLPRGMRTNLRCLNFCLLTTAVSMNSSIQFV